MGQKANHQPSSLAVIEALALTMEKDAMRERNKRYRDQKLRSAQIFRDKMTQQHHAQKASELPIDPANDANEGSGKLDRAIGGMRRKK